ncbi:hypothetical protein E2562_037987 [Oryza meyeriana var. granulata]|uniref:Uncharacterized protein n=1 Tax=Oryza meyeriana var. granulata TaxID=110450 RepID=A0A6G1E895_9ORYZ|nr:hypothetical protein E2562_037987 [Oryza meyeriana var. granulata]
MGGGAASSMVSGQNDAELDFNAVQRGDAEMAQKLYRVVRACAEMGESNPIISIHDQGVGGNCNVVKEIIYPKGAEIDIRSIAVGDHTLSVLEIWGAEYQEQDALLVKPESRSLLESLCERERVSMAVIGKIDGSGKIVLIDSAAVEHAKLNGLPPPTPVEDLELEKVLGDMPQKTFEFKRVSLASEPLDIAPETYADLTGGACAIGEQPMKGILNPRAMARLAVGEALTNLVWAKVSSLSDVKASGNWMYAAKLDGEGADMYDAAVALADCMIELGIATDGGKDSLSMAAQCDGEVVKAPGNLIISAYVTCPDITLTVTPDLKLGNDGVLQHIDLGKGKRRLGGSALAQAFNQIGNDCPDIDDVPYLKKAFEAVQELLSECLISAGHDISDGGLIVGALEMAFAGNCGVKLNIDLEGCGLLQALFAEELGFVLEVHLEDLSVVKQKLEAAGISANVIGQVTASSDIELVVDGRLHLKENVLDSAKGWAASIRFNQPLIQQFQNFYNRPDTFSLGVCNGCQLMALLGWVPGSDVGGSLGSGGDMSQPRFIHNESGRFECRFTSVSIGDSPAIMFKGMEGSTLGIWSAHGEGRAFFPDENILARIVKSNLVPVRYSDDANNITEVYPFNPNGSPLGIAALCSPDGRHLAMMPHPERCFMMWQYPWYPREWQVEKSGPSPWLRMFQNAREWCS